MSWGALLGSTPRNAIYLAHYTLRESPVSFAEYTEKIETESEELTIIFHLLLAKGFELKILSVVISFSE